MNNGRKEKKHIAIVSYGAAICGKTINNTYTPLEYRQTPRGDVNEQHKWCKTCRKVLASKPQR